MFHKPCQYPSRPFTSAVNVSYRTRAKLLNENRFCCPLEDDGEDLSIGNTGQRHCSSTYEKQRITTSPYDDSDISLSAAVRMPRWPPQQILCGIFSYAFARDRSLPLLAPFPSHISFISVSTAVFSYLTPENRGEMNPASTYPEPQAASSFLDTKDPGPFLEARKVDHN